MFKNFCTTFSNIHDMLWLYSMRTKNCTRGKNGWESSYISKHSFAKFHSRQSKISVFKGFYVYFLAKECLGKSCNDSHKTFFSPGAIFWKHNLLKGVCHEIFDLQFFSWFKPIWAPDKQAKVFSNSVSISPRYSNF